jgi:hypothetical protein
MAKLFYKFRLLALSLILSGLTFLVSAQETTEFHYTGGMQTYTVPAGVTKLFVDVLGARGGVNYYYSRPGSGGRVQATMTVTAGTVLNIFVGQVGYGSCYSVLGPSATVYPGGYNGGGSGYGYGGGGGGATDIRIGGTALANRVLVAGGGGASGYFGTTQNYERGGNGGGLTGENGYGDGVTTSTKRGVGGNQASGGAGGTYSTAGSAGSLGQGGNAGNVGYGGGGGGGYYGGGGGSYGGGGGGSSYTSATYCSNVTHTQGANSLQDGNGLVRITTMPTNAAAFAYTGGAQTYTVPSGVNYLLVDMEGANGGANVHWPNYTYKEIPGNGGRTKCYLPVTPGQSINVYVGGAGTQGGMSGTTPVAGVGGYNGGGNGTYYSTTYAAGGGGGASDIRIGGTALSNRKVVAGGGGGAGHYLTTTVGYSFGGNGGGLTGANGIAGSTSTGTVGGGTQTAGGTAGLGGVAGSLGQGGSLSGTSNPSGGGGGGYYGGGSGGYGSTTYSAGGGGGSSYTDAAALQVEHTQGFNYSGNGRVLLFPAAAAVTPSSTTMAFGNIGTGSASPAKSVSLTGMLLTSAGTLTINTSSSVFEFSFDGNTWFTSAQTYTYTGTEFSGLMLYVRYKPTSASASSGSISITGGGLASASTISLTGTGATACSGTPSAGTAGISPSSGNASTQFALTLTGASTAGSVEFQWQWSPDGTTWTNIPGATNATATYSGLLGTTQFRCRSYCPGSTVATSGVVSASLSLPAAGCVPTGRNSSTSYSVGTNTAPVMITGETMNISDASLYGSGTGGSSFFYNNTSMSVDFLVGNTYFATMSTTSCYVTGSIWIDFNDDGRFNNAEELVGGFKYLSAHASLGLTTCPSGRPRPSIVIPANARPGAHRMRVASGYAGTSITVPGCSAYYPLYPFMDVCSNTFVSYADSRDYTAIIKPKDPIVIATPTSLSFGSITTGDSSSPQVFSMTGNYMASSPVTLTAPANFEISLDGLSWSNSSTPLSYTFTGTSFSGAIVYARFKPTSNIAYSDNIMITGGGLLTTVNVAVTGNGAPVCTATPSAGTATINGGSSASGSSSTPFILNTTGTTVAGGLTYQWQIGSSSGGPFTDIPGANTIPYTYTGLAGNSWFQCVVTCPSSGSATTGTVNASFTLPASSCIPTAASTSCTYYVGTTGAPVIINGASGTVISDASPCGSGTGGSSRYYNNISQSVTFLGGSTYSATIGAQAYYTTGQIWIDFNDNGVFDNATETVGGFSAVPCCTTPSSRATVPIVIPASAAPGIHRMRVISGYTAGVSVPGSNASYPIYPLMEPCPTTTVQQNDIRDYSVLITAPPAVVAANPGTIDFADVNVGTAAVPVGVSVISGRYLLPSAGVLTITAPTGYEVSTNGTSWVGSLSLGYGGAAMSGSNVYVRFKPAAPGTVSGNISITGGGLAAPVTIAVTGSGNAATCSGTPTAGAAAISPSSGSSSTVFTLSLSGSTSANGLFYQWESSEDGTTWV